MFETSQQEPSSGTGKIIGGAIAVMLLLLLTVYFLHFHQEPASGPANQAGMAAGPATDAEAGPPDPLRDLAILRFALNRDQTETMAMWDIQLANRSRTYAYKDIRYVTNYYDAGETLLYRNEGTLSEQLDPGDQRTISRINDGLFPVGAARYTIEISGAEPVTQ